MASTPYLIFKYLKNVMIDLGDDQQHAIPSEPRAVPTPRGPATVHVFDMDREHKVRLKDERPKLPKRPTGMSESYYGKLCDKSYEIAGENRAFNDRVRARVTSYVENGTLEIVSDPFAGESEYEGIDPDLAAAVAAEKSTADALSDDQRAAQIAQSASEVAAALTKSRKSP